MFEGTTANTNINLYSLAQTIAVTDPLNPPTEFFLGGISEGKSYQVIVRDEDAHGNVNQNTNYKTVAVDDLTPPNFLGLSSLSQGTSGREDTELTVNFQTIALEANDPNGAHEYVIYWKQSVANDVCENHDGSKTVAANTLAANQPVSVVIDGLNEKTVYSVCVRASDSAGNFSTNSNFLILSLIHI